MNIGIKILNKLVLEFQNRTNKYFAQYRVRKVNDAKFTVISNNCWAGSLYRWLGLQYRTPTVGLYFYAEDYLKFLQRLDYYLSLDFEKITIEQSKYREKLYAKGQINVPIGKLGDIEVIFLHYDTFENAVDSWNRRKKRICADNLYVKMSEMNDCTPEIIRQFDTLPYRHKFILVTHDYGIKSQIISKDWVNESQIKDDTSWFNKYVNIITFLNG
jgi:uncharacterized protein (DUF1919 family)